MLLQRCAKARSEPLNIATPKPKSETTPKVFETECEAKEEPALRFPLSAYGASSLSTLMATQPDMSIDDELGRLRVMDWCAALSYD